MRAKSLCLAARITLICVVLWVVVTPSSALALQRPLLRLAVSDSAVDYTEDTCRRFGATHDGDVELIVLPTGTQNRIEFLTARYLGGVDMDVVHLTPEISGALTESGILTNLQDFLGRDQSIKLKDFIPAAIASYSRPSGALYAIPMDVATRSFMANLDMLYEAGLGNPNDLDPADWTWDKLASYGRRLTKVSATGSLDQIGFAWGESHTATIIHQGGGYMFDHTTAPTKTGMLLPETVAALEKWSSWFYPNPIATRSGKIQANKVAFAVQNSTDVRELVGSNTLFSWDVIRYPRGKAHNAVVETISAFGVVGNTKHPELSWKLLKFLVTDKQMARDLIAVRSRPPSYIPNLSLYVRESFPPGAPAGVYVYREMILHPEFQGKLSFPGADRFVDEFQRALRYEGITGQKAMRSILEDFNQRALLALSVLK